MSAAEEKVLDWSNGFVLRAGDMALGLYQPSPETTGYWEGVKRHELLVKQCVDCATLHHPRRIACSRCGSTAMSWKRAQGKGSVYTYSEIHRSADVFNAAVPYVVGIVKLVEGVYLFSRIIVPAGRKVAIGSTVSVEFRVLERGYLLPVFVMDEA